MTKTCVLFNEQSGTAHLGEAVRDVLRQEPGVSCHFMDSETSPQEFRRWVIAEKFKRVIIAGGDGSIHRMVNWLRGLRITFGVLPLGTGNDLCRSLGMPADPLAAAPLLRNAWRRKIDVIEAEGDFKGLIVNAATGGFSGRVAEETSGSRKETFGPLAYLIGAAGPMVNRQSYRLAVRFDSGPLETINALNIVIANGRTTAGGLMTAPTADLEDGLMDVVIVRSTEFLDASVIVARLMAGDYLTDENVSHRRCRRVEVSCKTPIPFSMDGDQITGSRFVFRSRHRALRMLVGPDYRAPGRRGWTQQIGRIAFKGLAGILHACRCVPRWLRGSDQLPGRGRSDSEQHEKQAVSSANG